VPTSRPIVNVAYAVPPGSRKAAAWHDGFTAGMEHLADEFDVRWLNLHPDHPDQAGHLKGLDDCDFLLVKSNWDWIVDRLVREHCAGGAVPKGILISGVGDPPRRRRRLRFYDVLWYQTPWYEPRLRRHPHRIHAFGVDTRVMRPLPGVERDVDWLSVGALRRYKRHERLLDKPGRRVVVGDLTDPDPGLLEELRDGGVEVVDFVTYDELGDYYRRARNVLIAAEVEGGGERSLLEARACGARVEIAEDNPKLRGLQEAPEIWDHRYYGEQLAKGIRRALGGLAVSTFPAHDEAPYLRMLHPALKRRGVDLVDLPSVHAAPGSPVDVVHLHWLEYLVSADSLARSAARVLRLRWTLARLRRLDKRIVFTVHNLRPHEPRHPRLEALATRSALRSADTVIAHSDFAARRIEDSYGEVRSLEVIPHGHFIGLYPPPSRGRAEIRAELGIPLEAFTYLLFGQLRRYKRVPAAIEAFSSLPDPNLRLIVAGSAWDPQVREAVERAAADDPRIVLMLEHVPDGRVAELHAAADAAVLPYRQVFSSGALLLALSHGLPVVAPLEGTTEIAGEPALESFNGHGLAPALDAIRRGDPRARGEAAREAAERFDWGPIAERTIAAYGGRGP
jgi:glycosyltransferase involved in cell wall biosynthesis